MIIKNIYPKDNCPICNGEIDNIEDIYFSCHNKCYSYGLEYEFDNLKYDNFYVFETDFMITENDNEERVKTVKKRISKVIEYWKHNERYLAKIMESK